MDSIFDLSRGLSSTIGRAVKAESMILNARFQALGGDVRQHDHRKYHHQRCNIIVDVFCLRGRRYILATHGPEATELTNDVTEPRLGFYYCVRSNVLII